MQFTVLGMPAPKGSTRAVHDRRGRVRVFGDNPRTIQWQRAVAWAARQAGAAVLDGPVRVTVVFQMPRGTTTRTQAKKPVGAPCVDTPDLDKLLRAVLDGLSGHCFVDDRQVAELHGCKVYGAAPGATITVTAQ